MKKTLRFRQIHLDFHTSEHIQNIGADFDPKQFAKTLKEAHVDSVTCFARCHHGWVYYDTKAHPHLRHPYLTRHLLNEQIEACHAEGIRVPIYTTVQWDHHVATQHPEWVVLDEFGHPRGTHIYEAGFYRYLCVNTPYREFLKEHVTDLFQSLPVDGLFFDISMPQDCSCKYCRQGMQDAGLDPTDTRARVAYGINMINEFKLEMSQFARAHDPDVTIFYNAAHVGPRHRSVQDAFTHFEIESLPSGFWGYLHFPVTMRYARTLDLDCLGMTAKFHTSWGDFHSFKNRQALEYECFRTLALGAKCSIGDQLHPRGGIDPHVYDLVGSVYSQVESKEPWCKDATPVVEIGVFTPEAFPSLPDATDGSLSPVMRGVTRMLEEGAYQFDIIDDASDFSRYKLLILPDTIPVTKQFGAKIEAFVDAGGSVIATFKAGLDPKGDEFSLRSLGISLVGDAPFSPDYLVPQGEIGKGLPQTEHVMYSRGMQVRPLDRASVLSQTLKPYFNRTYKHFSSHQHTPSSGEIAYPGIVRNGRSIYFAHPIFAQYDQNAPRWVKQLFHNALDVLLPEPLIRHDGPTTLEAHLTQQPKKNTWIVHLLHYIPQRRSKDMDIIEDVIPLYNVRISLNIPGVVQSARLVPQGEDISVQTAGNGRTELMIPQINGHEMVEIINE